MRPFVLTVCLGLLVAPKVLAADATLVVPPLVKPAMNPAQGDPLQEKYDAAWSRYEQSVAEVTAGMNKALDGLFDRAADAGKFDLAEMWDTKRKVFADTKTLEWPSDAKTKTEWRKRFPTIDFPEDCSESVNAARAGYAAAVTALKEDYEALVKEYTKERNLGRAKQLRDEVAALEWKPVPQPAPKPAPKPEPAPPVKPWPVAKKGAEQFKGHWYKVFAEKVPWHQAKAKCEEIGGHLVTVEDAQEEAFIGRLVAKAGRFEGVWLGVTDQG